MEFSVFKKIIEEINEVWNEMEALSSLGVDCYNTKTIKTFTNLETIFWNEVYGKDGADWISWFIYEKMAPKNPHELKAFDENGDEICSNIEGLYNYLEKNYSKHLDNSEK
jgi:hypothetical protein